MKLRDSWVWMPHPAHLIVCRDCRFHLATYVGGWLVSTLGEYLPDEPVREILAKSRGVTLVGNGDARLADFMEKVGYEEIGLNRKYETMVFRATQSKEECCPFTAADWQEKDFAAYNDAGEARKGHLAICEKWTLKKPE